MTWVRGRRSSRRSRRQRRARKSKRRLCRNCVTSVRDRLQIPANAESHRATRQGANSLHRLRGEVFRCCSVGFARIAFQACSFNHSDISPL